MARGLVRRFALVGMIVVALVAGAGVSVAAAGGREPEYSDADCEVIANIEVEGSDAGYYGKTTRNAANAYSAAAADIEDDDLKASMLTLAGVWRKASRGNAISAARAIGKAGKKYTGALETYTKALVACSTQDLGLDDEDDSSTSTASDDD